MKQLLRTFALAVAVPVVLLALGCAQSPTAPSTPDTPDQGVLTSGG
jgi:hypothetical protein